MSARALWLDSPAGPVFGLLDEAGPGRPDVAVLLVPPFGWEDECSYRSRRDWARHLAAQGRPVLRVDLPGSGDSAGSPGDADLFAAWEAAVAGAAERLRELSGAARVVALGIGLGGLIAWRAAAEGAAVDDLVLWGTPSRGRSLVRELRAFARLNAATASPPGTLPEGAMESGGFVLGPQTARELSALDLTALPLPGAEHRRVLLLGRDSLAVDEALREHVAVSGAELTVEAGPGYGAMIAAPQEATPPLEVFAAVDRWLGAAAAPPVSERPHPPAPAPTTAELAPGGVRESAFTVEGPSGGLFGVLSEPADGRPADVCLVMLNAGAIRRIGPNRMWVEVARRWAAHGVASLRLDVEAIGDSDGDASRYRTNDELYDAGRLADVTAALDALERRGVASRFVVMGLCSGAYWAFHTTVRDPRVTGAILLNPRALVWDPMLDPMRDARRTKRVLAGSSWRRLVRGQVTLRRLREVALAALLAPLRRRAAAAAQATRSAELDTLLERLGTRAAPVLLVFGDDEPLREELEAEGRLATLERWPNLRLELIPGDDHTLRPVATQRLVHDLIDRALDELSGVPAAAAA